MVESAPLLREYTSDRIVGSNPTRPAIDYKRTFTRPIIEDDILVVTPYNVQVNYLRSILPDNAKVGTVDKFQGQEAPIVLISMVTSSA